eukprot:GHRQ01028812.1.p1 GENE.GHRQ01028812.1~~GHRQ01028812.1.p1  ORF type:complete len:248 (-),score=1.08 GHRQ01028812.1:209-952(-)
MLPWYALLTVLQVRMLSTDAGGVYKGRHGNCDTAYVVTASFEFVEQTGEGDAAEVTPTGMQGRSVAIGEYAPVPGNPQRLTTKFKSRCSLLNPCDMLSDRQVTQVLSACIALYLCCLRAVWAWQGWCPHGGAFSCRIRFNCSTMRPPSNYGWVKQVLAGVDWRWRQGRPRLPCFSTASVYNSVPLNVKACTALLEELGDSGISARLPCCCFCVGMVSLCFGTYSLYLLWLRSLKMARRGLPHSCLKG